MSTPAAAYLDLFSRPLVQSPASRAYHAQFMETNDHVLWLSRLRLPRTPNWLDTLVEHGVKPRGVLHVGAHYGLELESYLAKGCQRVTFFEASPLVLGQLRAHVEFWREWLTNLGVPEPMTIEVVECAVSDCEGTREMYLTELEMLSSLQPPSADWIRVQHQQSVACARLDTLVKRPEDYNILNLDVQGHELSVLTGAVGTLSGLDAILVELNFTPRYQNCALAAEVNRWLADAGWTCVSQSRYGDVADALYLRA